MNKRPGGIAGVIAGAAVALATCASTALAQTAIDTGRVPVSNEPPVPVLRLASSPAIKSGKVAAVKGTVTGAGLRFAVGNLSILQPVVITLFAGEPADHLKLTLFKTDWKQLRRAGATGTSGNVSFTFRTEGGVNMLVQSSGYSRPFTLVAWAGDEIYPSSMKPVIVTPAQFQGKAYAWREVATTASESLPVLLSTTPPAGRRPGPFRWVGAGGLGVLALVVGVLVFRRTRNRCPA